MAGRPTPNVLADHVLRRAHPDVGGQAPYSSGAGIVPGIRREGVSMVGAPMIRRVGLR